jgi:hypothetical protein
MDKSKVCRIANRISRDISCHDAFVQARAIVKKGAVEIKAAGTSFGRRPEALTRRAAMADKSRRHRGRLFHKPVGFTGEVNKQSGNRNGKSGMNGSGRER